MDLENRKNELSRAFRNNEPIIVSVLLENGETKVRTVNPTDLDYVSSYHKESQYLNKQIRKMKLEYDYMNKRPIMYHFIDDDGQEDDIMLDSFDKNYEKAYKQQLEIIERGYHTSEDEVDAVFNQIHKDIELDAEADKLMAELYAEKQKNKMSEDQELASKDLKVSNNNQSVAVSLQNQEDERVIPSELDDFENQNDIRDDNEQTESESIEVDSDKANIIQTDQELSSNFQANDCAVFKCGNVITVIGDIGDIGFKGLGAYLNSRSEIFRNRKVPGDKVQLINKLPRNRIYTINSTDAEVIFDVNGNFKIKGAEEIENLGVYKVSNKFANSDIDVNKVLEYAKNDQKDEIIALVKDKGYRYVKDVMYEAIYDKLSEPCDERDNYYKFLDIVNEAFKDNGELKNDESISESANDEEIIADESVSEPTKDEEIIVDKTISKNVKDENQEKNDKLLKQAREGKITWRKFYEKYNLPSTAKKVTVKESKPSKLNKLKNNVRNLNGLQKASFIFGIMSGIGTGHYLLDEKFAIKVNKLLFGDPQDSRSKSVKGGKR